MAKAKRPGSVDGGRGERLGGRQAHLQAGQREDEGHRGNRRGAGIEVRGQHNRQPQLDHRARRGISGPPQGKDRPGQQDRLDAGNLQCAQSLLRRGFQVIGRGRAQLGGQQGSRAWTELLGMNAQTQAMPLCRGQHRARLLHREGVVVAEGVAKLRQPGRGHFGNQLFGYPAHVFLAAAGKLRRTSVRGQQRGHNARGAFLVEPRQHPQHFQLRRVVQPIAGLPFDRRCACPEHPVAMLARRSQ